MELIIIYSLVFILIAIYFKFFSNTIIGINIIKGHYLGIYFALSLFVFILPGIVALNHIPIKNIWVAFKVKQENIFFNSLVILSSLILFLLTALIVSRKWKNLLRASSPNFSLAEEKKLLNFCKTTLLILSISIILLFFVGNINHSLFSAIFLDKSLSTERYVIRNSSLPIKLFAHLTLLISPFISSIIGWLQISKLNRAILLMTTLFVASWSGSKAPLLIVIIVFICSYLTRNKIPLHKKLIQGFLVFLIMLFGTYRLVIIQYAAFSDIQLFVDYFFQRVFIAPVIGTYEQLDIKLFNPQYILHSIPGVSSFFEVPNFQKELMMVSESRTDPSNIGIKNTLFIAEGHAIAGKLGIIFSILLYCFNYFLSFKFILIMFSKKFLIPPEKIKPVIAIAFLSYLKINGGLSDILFFKTPILMAVTLFPILLLTKLINRLKW